MARDRPFLHHIPTRSLLQFGCTHLLLASNDVHRPSTPIPRISRLKTHRQPQSSKYTCLFIHRSPRTPALLCCGASVNVLNPSSVHPAASLTYLSYQRLAHAGCLHCFSLVPPSRRGLYKQVPSRLPRRTSRL